MSVIAIPNILREKLGEAVVQALLEVLNQLEDRTKDRAIESVEHRFEKRLTEEMGKLRVEVHSIRADVIKWMFLFWVGQVATITGLFAFFRK
jgi:hypothetical protein